MQANKLQSIGDILTKAGFNHNETMTYLALLRLGKGTVSEVTRAAGIGRTYGYPILDILATKGLVGVSGKKPKQEYFAESPRKLLSYLENNLENQKDIIGEVRHFLPDLVVLHNVEDRPKIRFYEGTAGLKEVYEDTLSAKGNIYACSTYEDMHKVLPNYFPGYYERRAKKNIFARGIVTDTPLAHIRMKKDKDEARELTLVPSKEFPIPTEIDIYDDKVMIASWREKLGVIIESQEIAETLRSIFKLALIGAKEVRLKK